MRHSSHQIITIILFALMVIPFASSSSADAQSFKPSFDCLKATTIVEKTICGDQKLSGLDAELDSIYKKLLTDLPDLEKKNLKQEQLAWLKNRDKTCAALTNLSVCISDRYLQRIEALKKQDTHNRIERLTAYQKKYDFRKLTFGDIVGNDNILIDLYSVRDEEVVTISKKDITLLLYTVKYDELIYNDLIPKSIVIVKGDGKETRLPIEAYQPLTEIDNEIPATKSPVLLIKNPRGGNGWNSNPYYVISLENQFYLKNVGVASGYRDLNHDGIDELISFDGIWEIGLGLLSHSDSPGAIIVLGVENGRISPDINHFASFYTAEINRLNDEISKYPKTLPPTWNSQLLSVILQKFLIYHLLGEDKKGWEEFYKDIRHYDKDNYYLNGGVTGVGVKKIPIDEIVAKMKVSLEKRR